MTAIKFCEVYHFGDDTNLLCLGNSIKKLNKLVSADLKVLVKWLNANKISFNVKKKQTETIIFKSKQKKFEGDLKIKLSGKRLYPVISPRQKMPTRKMFNRFHVGQNGIRVGNFQIIVFFQIFN